MRFLLLLSLFNSIVRADIAKQENEPPLYLQGIGWENVEAELRKDIFLPSHVRPIHYHMRLNVSISGYGNAKTSTYNGSVHISLNITAPLSEIEVHSVGLTIKEACVKLSVFRSAKWKIVNDGIFHIRQERELIAIPSRRLILPGERVSLMILYNGTARMNGRGFYESWNQRENSTDLPYISLVTNCEPTGARTWFPCFDEPDKKATFQLSVAHPIETTAYSNTPILSTSENPDASTRVTHFAQTVPLPTYVVAVALTEQPVVELNVDGYEFRAIGYDRQRAVETVANAFSILQNNSIFEGVPFIPNKTDILLVDDFIVLAMENPGLITFNMKRANDSQIHVHELAHMYFGNLVTLSTWGDMWVNEGFAYFYDNNQLPTSHFSDTSIPFTSLHDRPIHSTNMFASSIHVKNFIKSQPHIHYTRASQVLRLIRKFIGDESFDRAIKKYLFENAYGNGDATKVIRCIINEYDGDRHQLEKILYEWIYQPGLAILFMERKEDEDENTCRHMIKIYQKRYHSSFFDETLRDEKTRFSIPLFCTIDGVPQTFVFDSDADSLTIPIDANSTFEIEDNYGELFGIWSPPNLLSFDQDKMAQFTWLSSNLVRSGHIGINEFADVISPLAGNTSVVRKTLRQIIQHLNNSNDDDPWDQTKIFCEEKWKGMLNEPLDKMLKEYMKEASSHYFINMCCIEAKDRKKMKEFLHNNIITDEVKIKSVDIRRLIHSLERLHPGIAMEFLMKELEKDPISLEMRYNVRDILVATYKNNYGDLSFLHELIRRYPSIAAENSEIIVEILERKYLMDAMKTKEIELKNTINEILENFFIHSIRVSITRSQS